ncbi:hypothetical protein HGA10_22230 [Nocardia coubleae]|uniref:Uncharacterized protein n=1 Tax=Nocardia coubleae TaxID=356147 RepID=A0A846WB26_9NOCA|nr:hypothetical protein [Nocardia coubleae]
MEAGRPPASPEDLADPNTSQNTGPAGKAEPDNRPDTTEPDTTASDSTVAADRQQALQDVLADIARDGIEVRSDQEADEYLNFCARMQGIAPEDMHAVTLGDLIMIRPEHATDVRILREEWIHTRQNAAGEVSAGADGGGSIVDNEIEAREMIIANRDKWAITDEEVEEMKREIAQMRETGRY